MEFKINKQTILQALTKIQGITGKKTNIAITSSVLLTAKQGLLYITATDLEMAFHGTYEAEIIKDGSIAIPSRKFFEIVKDFPDEKVILKELENKWIHIADKNVEYSIVGIESDDFPELPAVDGVELLDMDSEIFKNMIEKTVIAVLSDEGRAHLAGVFFEKGVEDEKEIIRMVSTDGHRLSKIEQPIEGKNNLSLKEGVIIPKSGIVEILRILESGKKIHIGCKDNNFIVEKDNEKLIIRLIEGEFPDYQLVIPKKNKGELRVEKRTFLMMLKRMSILSSDKYRSVRFKIEKEKMETITMNPEIGESKEVIDVDYTGDPIEIAFNPRYFVDVLNTMESHDIIIKLHDEATPCILEGDMDPYFLSVIMPMRI
jgi:DNA polymerase III subunit beta